MCISKSWHLSPARLGHDLRQHRQSVLRLTSRRHALRADAAAIAPSQQVLRIFRRRQDCGLGEYTMVLRDLPAPDNDRTRRTLLAALGSQLAACSELGT
jgi:hypothetical protein